MEEFLNFHRDHREMHALCQVSCVPLHDRDNIVSQNIERGTVNAKACFHLGLIHSRATRSYYPSNRCKELETIPRNLIKIQIIICIQILDLIH